MTTLTSTQPPAGVAHRLHGRTRAATNFAIFAAVAVTIGWAGIALDRAMDEPRGNSLGMGLWLVLPALTAVLLFRLGPDGGGPLGLTLRFPQRTRWFTFAALFYLPFTALIVLAGIASGLASFDASGAAGKPTLLAAIVGALAPLALKNFFEELAWRGFGTRTAIAAGLPRLASLGALHPPLLRRRARLRRRLRRAAAPHRLDLARRAHAHGRRRPRQHAHPRRPPHLQQPRRRALLARPQLARQHPPPRPRRPPADAPCEGGLAIRTLSWSCASRPRSASSRRPRFPSAALRRYKPSATG